jgi:hypothetical protein
MLYYVMPFVEGGSLRAQLQQLADRLEQIGRRELTD